MRKRKGKKSIALLLVLSLITSVMIMPSESEAEGAVGTALKVVEVVVDLIKPDPYEDIADSMKLIASQVYEVEGGVSEILEKTEVMMDDIQEIQSSLDNIEESIDELQNLIEKEFAESDYEDNIDIMAEVYNRIEPHWEAYVTLCTNIEDGVYTTEEQRDDAIKNFMIALAEEYRGDHTFSEELLTMYNIMDDTNDSVTDSRIAVDKLTYPFEHQLYEGACETFNYGLMLQGMLLQLYSEYTAYNAKLAINKQDSQCGAAFYDFVIETNTDRINEEIANAPVLMSPDDIKSSIYLPGDQPDTFSHTPTELETYHLIINETGQEIMIARESGTIDEFVSSPYESYTEAYDPTEWQAPDSVSELQKIIPSDVSNPMEWFLIDGGLAELGVGAIDAFTMANTTAGATFAQAGMSTDDADSIFSLKIVDDKFYDDTPMYFASKNATIDPNDVSILPIYIWNDTSTDDIPIDETGTYVPTSPSQIPKDFTLNDGETIDFSGLTTMVFATGTTITTNGNATIKGNGATLSNINIVNNGNLTINNVSFSNGTEDPTLSCSLNSQVYIIKKVGLSSTASTALYVRDGVSIFGIESCGDEYYGDATLTLTGSGSDGLFGYLEYSYSSSEVDVEFQDLNLNLVNDTHNVITTSDVTAYAKSCDVDISAPSTVSFINFAFEYCDLTGTQFNSCKRLYYSDLYHDEDSYTCTVTVSDNSKSSTIDNTYYTIVGTNLNGQSSSFKYSYNSVDKDEKYTYTTTHETYEGAVSYISFKKPNGVNGVKISSISVQQRMNGIYWSTGYFSVDDNKVHELYDSTPDTYTTHTFSSIENLEYATVELRTMSVSASSTNAVGLSVDEFEWLKDHLSELDGDTVFHMPVNLSQIQNADGELLEALAESDGELMLDITGNNGELISFLFNAAEVKSELAEDVNVGFVLTDNEDLKYEDLPEEAAIFEFTEESNVTGLTHMMINPSETVDIAYGKTFDIYQIVDGEAVLIEDDLEVSEIDRLDFEVDTVGTYAIVDNGSIAPETGDTNTSVMMLVIMMLSGIGIVYMGINRKKYY